MKLLIYSVVSFLFLMTITEFSPEKSEIFPEIEGLKITGEVETYERNNLYDYINGAADSYLKYDFEELNLMRYEGTDEEELKIEIYKHSNDNNAFGIYGNEKPLEGEWIEIGTEGYKEIDLLNFYKGNYYVKIMTYKLDDKPELMETAAIKVAEKLEGSTSPPESASMFPDKNKIPNSVRFINKNFLGYSSLSEAFTADYEEGEYYFNMFIISKKNFSACKEMLAEYFKTINFTGDLKEGQINIDDPYQGKIRVFWDDNLVLGIMNLDDDKLSAGYLKLLISASTED